MGIKWKLWTKSIKTKLIKAPNWTFWGNPWKLLFQKFLRGFPTKDFHTFVLYNDIFGKSGTSFFINEQGSTHTHTFIIDKHFSIKRRIQDFAKKFFFWLSCLINSDPMKTFSPKINCLDVLQVFGKAEKRGKVVLMGKITPFSTRPLHTFWIMRIKLNFKQLGIR